MEEDFFDELSSDQEDDMAAYSCKNCGSSYVSPNGVCMLCSTENRSWIHRHPKKEGIVSSRSQERREKLTMYFGLVLIVLGGPGIVAASYLHDWLSIPAPSPAFNTYEAFGPVNSFVAILGLAITVIGIFSLVVSLMISKKMDRAQLPEFSQ